MDPTKIHPVLMDEMALAARSLDPAVGDAGAELPIIVRMSSARSMEMGALDAGRTMRVERTINLVSAVAGTATREEIAALSQSNMVEMIWLDEPVYAVLDTSVPLIGVPLIWQNGNEGEGVRICIVDTGIDANHTDFQGRIAAVEDFTGEGNGDGHGHGTHVAGIAAGSGAASNGRYRGVAPKATILAAKVLRSDGNGRMSFVMAGIEWAVEQGAQVINLSLGSRGACNGTDATSVACDAAVEAGAVVVVAAGNDGPRGSTVGAPGCAFQVITVGASTDTDTIADFSSRGPTADGRVKPDIVLPGALIIAARAQGTSLGQPLNEQYTSVNGTSMACPHAAGVAALMLAANRYLRPADVKRIMQAAVKQLGVDENMQGRGRLLPVEAVAMARQEAPAPAPDPTPSPSPTPPGTPPVPPTPEPPPLPGDPSPGPEPAPPELEGCLGPLVRLFGRKS